MGLFNFGKKKFPKPVITEMHAYENGIEVPLNLSKQDPDDKIMPLSYYQTIDREIKPLENVMVGFAVASREQKAVDDKIKVLEAFVESYNALKEKCYSLGPDYQKYFWDSWEAPKEKHGKPWQYYKQFADELQDLKANRDSILDAGNRRAEAQADLDTSLLSIVKENPGILQTEIYKKFDTSVRPDISEKLYLWEKQGRIKREKSGRSYAITFVK